MVSLEWRAWHRSQTGKVTEFKRMSQFPKLDKKNYQWRLETPDDEEFYAENYVRAWKPCTPASAHGASMQLQKPA
jgi:hypothetical protein